MAVLKTAPAAVPYALGPIPAGPGSGQARPVTASKPLLEVPANVPGGASYAHLGYVDAYDAVLNCDYAFLAYRETDSSGDWRVRIKSSQTAGAVFEPAAMKSQAK